MQDKTIRIEISEIVPPFWDLLEINTEDRIIFLGADTISGLINFRLEEIKKCNRIIAEERTRQKLSKSGRMLYNSAQRTISKLSGRKSRDTLEIVYLTTLIGKAERLEGGDRKPCLPLTRSFDHFVVGEKTRYYTGNRWIFAEILEGRKDDDLYPFVSVGLNGFSPNGKETVCPIRHPGILKIREFAYLKNHPDFAAIWVKIIKLFSKEMDPDNMARSIRTTD